MQSNDFNAGFLAEGLQSPRQVCVLDVVMKAACEAHEGVTGKTDLFLSAFTFPMEFIEEVKKSGRTAGYSGACWGKYLWFDIDRPGDLNAAVRDTVTLTQWIVETLRVSCVQIWFSGMKGFHVGVPIRIFGEAAAPSEQFASQCKMVAMNIAERAGVVIDASVYDRVRLFRCPNTKHGTSGLYKIPVALDELLEHGDTAWLLERAKAPRRLLLTTDSASNVVGGDVTCCETTTCVYKARDFWFNVVNEKERDTDTSTGWRAQSQTLPESGNTHPRLRRETLEFILEGVGEGERAVQLFKAAADCIRCGWSEDAIYSLLPDAARRTGLNIYEIEKQIRDGILAEIGGAA